jgi:HlyD family secretion protein
MIGKVAEVFADQGDTVTNGQTLARLEASDFDDSVRAAEAALSQAQAELAKAQVDLKRDRDLVQGKVISQSDFDVTETAYRVCEARAKNAGAQLGIARARLADTQIPSPIAGLVITRNLEVGSTVVPGTPIFRLAETNVLWVQAMVDEREAGKLSIGQATRVTFRAAPGQSFPGRLGRLARETDRVTEEREADVTVERLPSEWFIGAKADVYIETARKADVPQIAVNAIVRRGDKPGVFVIVGGRAHWRPVSLGLMGRETVELVNGVEPNSLVIANPFADKKPLTDGQRVAPTNTKGRP